MGKRTNVYRKVKTLPKNALTIAEFPDSRSVSDKAIFNQWRRRLNKGSLIDFEIISFQKIGFVIPKKRKTA